MTHNKFFRQNIRESMCGRPSVQKLLTIISGKPIIGQKKTNIPVFMEIAMTLILLIATTVAPTIYYEELSALILITLIPVCWVISTGCLRKFQVTYAHHAVHNCLFSSNRHINKIMLTACTVIPIAQNGKDYKTDHLSHHDNSIFTTNRDSDASFLLEIGFKPGESLLFYKKLLLRTILNPFFHFHFIKNRLFSHINRGSIMENIIGLLWLSLVSLIVVTNPIGAFIFIIIPVFILYNISALLQFLTEHAWLLTKNAPADEKEYESRCWGRFIGEPFPRNSNLTHLIKWWLKMIFIHAPVRISVFCGDLPVHDWHHLSGQFGQSSTQWQNSIYLREEAVHMNESSLGQREIWGLKNMIMNSFHYLSQGEK